MRSGNSLADVPVLKRLGLNFFGGKNEFVDIGTVELGGSRNVKVEVCCMPAQFWRFTITRPSRNGPDTFVMTTGSGSLSDFWPIAKMVANDMLSIERA